MKSKKRSDVKTSGAAAKIILLPIKLLRTFFRLLSRSWFRYALLSLIAIAGLSLGAEHLLRGLDIISESRGEALKKVAPVTAAVWLTLLTGIALVRRFSRLTIKKLDSMEGHEFEYACAGILRANGFKNVEVTKGSGDFGVDITAVRKRQKYAVQCKRYDKKLNNSAIQEVIGGLAVYGCTKGAVMTNSYFTEPAKKLAEANGIELWDRDVLTAMLDKNGTKKAVRESIPDPTDDPEAVCSETVESFFEAKNISVQVLRTELLEDSSELLMEIVPETGVRISEIKSLTDELANYAGWEYVTCVFPSKTAGTVDLEIPLPMSDDTEE